ncbi:MAG: T9SS type A sorting domain-containing protein [candidate division KSB1 bacterium]|nr:T9SS type A sorting domain-containing protein [candidate division KSB1 bacterium]MDZ7346328.1 T9SS type A sorting domain-containing protein [candidate division KSB1 bacterium]
MRGKILLLVLFAFLAAATLLQAQSKGTIVFVSYQVETKIDPVTNDYPDMPHINALRNAGYDVIIFYNAALSTAGQETLDTLYNADLIVMGRSTPSPGYGDHKAAWNEITTPILNIELWNCRSNRLNWFNTNNMVSMTEEGVIRNAIIEEPDDPVFEGIDTSGPVPWVNGPMDAVGTTDAGYGICLARLETDGTVLFVRFEPDIEFYPGSIDAPGGPRTVIGNGRDNSGGPPFNYYNFTPESEKVFLAEVARMVAIGKGSRVTNKEIFAPKTAHLSQNYPNPFNPTTTIPFKLNKKSQVRMVLVNTAGKVVAELINGIYEAGNHEITFDASHLPAGVYFYRMEAENFSATRKMILVK